MTNQSKTPITDSLRGKLSRKQSYNLALVEQLGEVCFPITNGKYGGVTWGTINSLVNKGLVEIVKDKGGYGSTRFVTVVMAEIEPVQCDGPQSPSVRYRVHAEGERVNESNTYFTSLKKAKDYMKRKYDFYLEFEASLFTLIKEVRDGETSNYDGECINTRTTIINL